MNKSVIKEPSNSATVLFLCAAALGTLVYFPFVLDQTLVSRFLALSLGLLIIVVKYPAFFSQKIPLPLIFNLGFYLISFSTIAFSKSGSETLFESQKIFIGAVVWYTVFYLLKNGSGFSEKFLKLMLFITLMAHLVGLYQLINVQSINQDSVYAVTSLCGHKNLYSSLTFILLLFCCLGMWTHQGLWKFLFVSCNVFSLLMILVLQTRAVWIGTIVFLFIFAMVVLFKIRLRTIINFQLSWKWAGFFIAMFLIFTSMFWNKLRWPELHKRFDVTSYHASESGHERLVLWEKTGQLITSNPLLGVGAGNWQLEYPSVTLSGLHNAEVNNVTFQRPHNDFLWVLSETGFAGFLFYISSFFIVFSSAWKALKKSGPQQSLVIGLLLAGAIGFLTIAFFDFPRERIEHVVLFSCLTAFLYFKSEEGQAPGSSARSIHIKKFSWALIALLSLNIVIGVFRVKGEYYMAQAYKQRQRQHWMQVVKMVGKAYSYFYQIDPTSVPLKWYSGLAYFSLGEYPAALTDFEQAYAIAPYNQHVLNNLASSEENLSRHEDAMKHYKEAIRINPLFDDPKLNLAAVLYNEKKYKEALHWVEMVPDDNKRKAMYSQTILEAMKWKN